MQSSSRFRGVLMAASLMAATAASGIATPDLGRLAQPTVPTPQAKARQRRRTVLVQRNRSLSHDHVEWNNAIEAKRLEKQTNKEYARRTAALEAFQTDTRAQA